MAWQAAAAGFTAAYNLYNFDQQYNQGRLANFVRNRRRRDPSQRMPRGMAVYSKRRRTDGVRGGDAVGVGGAYVNDIHYKRKRTLGKVNLRKLAKQGTTALYDRFQIMGRYGNTAGNLVLGRLDAVTTQAGNALAGYAGLPAYLWDLTASNNVVGGGQLYPLAGFRYIKDTAAGTIAYTAVNGQDITSGAAGANYGTSNYQYYDTSKIATNLEGPIEQGLLDWVKIQMVVWGPKKASTKVFVELCQMDELLSPACINLQNTAATARCNTVVSPHSDPVEGGTKNQDLYYTNEFTRLIDTPFATFTKEVRKMRYKVLDRKVLEFSPVASFEENGSALSHKQTLNAFYKMGRKCNFAWNNDQPQTANTLGNSVIETQVNRGQHDCYVHPNARVFLKVYAQVFQTVGEGAFTGAEDAYPSFDIRISRKWIISE